MFIANPNNPTGTYINGEELRRLHAGLPDSCLFLIDDAYAEYVTAEDYDTGLALADEFDNVVVTRTFSKVYGLAALRIGYSVSQPEIADLLNRVRQPFNINAMSLVAAVAALDDQEHVSAAVEANKQGMERLVVACETLGLGYIPSAGNFLTIDMGQDAAPIYEALLKLGVIVRPIGVYEMPNHLRVTVGLPEENTRFIDALTTVFGGL